ncbi:MAG: hypothetical protein M1831_004262 [Alyxoria varia]|nr:MAG: hypothetical protein M1831_004262 [Alyxoria varia]
MIRAARSALGFSRASKADQAYVAGRRLAQDAEEWAQEVEEERAPPAQGQAQVTEIGQEIYIFCHARTNQVVYSLNSRLQLNDALKQMPFLGKRTQRPYIRPDFWRRIAKVQFPSGEQGLLAYKALREYAVRHLHEWDPKWKQLPQKERGKKLQDQKANSIADLAAVLFMQQKLANQQEAAFRTYVHEELKAMETAEETLPKIKREMEHLEAEDSQSPEAREKYKALKRDKMHIRKALKKPVVSKALAGEYDVRNDDRPTAKRGMGHERGNREEPRLSMEDKKMAERMLPQIEEEMGYLEAGGLESQETRKKYMELKRDKMYIKKALHNVRDDPEPVAKRRVGQKRRKTKEPWVSMEGVTITEEPRLSMEGNAATREPKLTMEADAVTEEPKLSLERVATTEEPRLNMERVAIAWADDKDAQFARTWPKTVEHSSEKKEDLDRVAENLQARLNQYLIRTGQTEEMEEQDDFTDSENELEHPKQGAGEKLLAPLRFFQNWRASRP